MKQRPQKVVPIKEALLEQAIAGQAAARLAGQRAYTAEQELRKERAELAAKDAKLKEQANLHRARHGMQKASLETADKKIARLTQSEASFRLALEAKEKLFSESQAQLKSQSHQAQNVKRALQEERDGKLAIHQKAEQLEVQLQEALARRDDAQRLADATRSRLEADSEQHISELNGLLKQQDEHSGRQQAQTENLQALLNQTREELVNARAAEGVALVGPSSSSIMEVAVVRSAFEAELEDGEFATPEGAQPLHEAVVPAQRRSGHAASAAFLSAPLPEGVHSKWIDAENGKGKVRCSHCSKDYAMRNFKFDFFDAHLAICPKAKDKMPKSEQSCGSLARFGQIRVTRSNFKLDSDGQAVLPAAPPPVKSDAIGKCRGMYPPMALFSLDMSLEKAFRASRLVSEVPLSFEMQVIRIAMETYMTYERNADKGCLLPGEKLLSLHSRQCASLGEQSSADTQSHIGVRSVADKFVELLGRTWPQCKRCVDFQELFKASHKRLLTLLQPVMLLKLSSPPQQAIQVLEKALHCSGGHSWKEEALDELKDMCKAKVGFMKLLSEGGAMMPDDMPKDAESFLRNVRLVVLRNQGAIRNTAIYGAFQAMVSNFMADDGTQLSPLYKHPQFKDYVISHQLLTPKGTRHNQAALFQNKGPHMSTVKRWKQAEKRALPSCILDDSPVNMGGRVRHLALTQMPAVSPEPEVTEIITVAIDALVAVKRLVCSRRFNIAVGASSASGLHMA